MLTANDAVDENALRAAGNEIVDWHRLLRLSQNERAVSVVYSRLRSGLAHLVPSDVLDQMRRNALVSDFAMLHLETRLRDSLAALAQTQTRVMLLKGAALAYSVYGDVRARPMSDIDMLVDANDAEKARRAMLQTGWHEVAGGVPDSLYEQHQHLPPLKDTRGPDLHLEIHTALFPQPQPFAFGSEDLWSRARLLDEAVGKTFVPDLAHSLLFACLHFAWSHQVCFGAWRTVRDVDAIARRPDFDWDEFVAVARRTRGETSCYWTLRIARSASGVEVPARVLVELRPRRNAYLLRALEHHFLTNLVLGQSSCPSTTLSHALWEVGLMPRRSGHGNIRPWDREDEFVASDDATPAELVRAHRVRSMLASPAYVLRLLSTAR